MKIEHFHSNYTYFYMHTNEANEQESKRASEQTSLVTHTTEAIFPISNRTRFLNAYEQETVKKMTDWREKWKM